MTHPSRVRSSDFIWRSSHNSLSGFCDRPELTIRHQPYEGILYFQFLARRPQRRRLWVLDEQRWILCRRNLDQMPEHFDRVRLGLDLFGKEVFDADGADDFEKVCMNDKFRQPDLWEARAENEEAQ